MFVSLFIGNPPENVDSQESFSLIEMANKKNGLKESISGKVVPIQNLRASYHVQGHEFKMRKDTMVRRAVDQSTGIDIGVLGVNTIDHYPLRITHDTLTLHPRFSFARVRESDTKSYNQVFVNIDTDVFVPEIYQIPDGIIVKDTYHYGRHYYGFILEKIGDIASTTTTLPIEIYGYDKRLPDTSKLSRYRCIKIYVNERRATAEENESHPGEPCILHSITTEISAFSKEKKALFFKAKAMYEQKQKARFVHLTGPLFTTNIIGSIPEKEAFEIIERAKTKNEIPVGYETKYFYVDMDSYDTYEDWSNAVIDKMIELGNNKVRAVAMLNDFKIDIKDFRRTKMHHLIKIDEDGTSKTLMTNR